MIARLINHWNDDPVMSKMLGGKRLQATWKDDVLAVAWEGQPPFFVEGGIEAGQVGWTDVLTDLIEELERQKL